MTVRLELELGLGAPDIEARGVLDAFGAILSMLRALDAQRDPARWYFAELRLGSFIATWAPDSRDDDAAAEAAGLRLVRGFEQAEHEAALPDAWDLGVAGSGRRVASQLGDDPARGHMHLRLVGDHEREECTVTKRAASNLAAASRASTESIGSVTGIIGSVSVRGRRLAGIWQENGPRVRIEFAEEQLDGVAAALGRRVIVSGLLRRNQRGQAISVKMRRLLTLDPVEDLTELVGLDPDITAPGVSAVDHVRVIRGSAERVRRRLS